MVCCALISACFYRRLHRQQAVGWARGCIVDKNKAMAQFNKADALYREGRYAEALVVLDELNALYPNTPNILLPRARCLYRLRRVREAIDVCNILISQHKNERALQLKQSIMKKADRADKEAPAEQQELPGAFNLDDLLGPPPAHPAPKVQAAGGDRFAWLSTPVVIGVGIIVGLILIVVLVNAFGGSEKTSPTPKAEVAQGSPAEENAVQERSTQPISVTPDGRLAVFGWALSRVGWFLIVLVLTTIQYTVALYCTLRVT